MRGALAAAGVSAPLVGPESATGNWLQAYAATEGSSVAALSAHLYPLDRCRSERLLPHGPSIAQLLSGAVQQSETRRIRELAATAASHALPLHIDELGSVACGGQPGTSDTFAAALWALDAALLAAREGVAAVNFTSGLGSCQAGGTLLSPWYSPLCTLADGQLTARPEYYALLLLHSLEGDAFMPLSLHTSRNIAAFALRAPDRAMHVVIDDMETASAGTASAHASGAPRPATVTLEVGSSYRRATALRMSAPSAGALQGTTLGGVALRQNGTLPTPRSAALADADGTVHGRARAGERDARDALAARRLIVVVPELLERPRARFATFGFGAGEPALSSSVYRTPYWARARAGTVLRSDPRCSIPGCCRGTPDCRGPRWRGSRSRRDPRADSD